MRWLGRQGLVVCDVVVFVHEGEYHIPHSSRMSLRHPLGDPACSWEEDIGGSQGLETVEAGETCAIVGML